MRLTAQRLGHRYGADLPWMLDDVDITVRLGETVALLGPSGSGKTTLLALLGGLLRPVRGKVSVVDDEGACHPDVARYVSWVLQTTNFLPDRDVLHNVAISALGDGVTRLEARSRATAALAHVGLSGLALRPARTLSGGEVQRVAVARALVGTRPFVLADEPTGQLDHRTTRGVLAVLLGPREDRGVLVVTHDEEVAARCDRTLRLMDGALLSEGAQ